MLSKTQKTMSSNDNIEMLQQQQDQEPSIDTDKLSYEIFSILESKFLFGYDDQKIWLPAKPIIPDDHDTLKTTLLSQPGNEYDLAKNQRGKICVLSIDGGPALRSLVSGKTLSYLETALKSKSGNPESRIADFFDVAAGTGTGGIFTAMLFSSYDHNRPIFNADETWKFISLMKPDKKPKKLLKKFFKKKSSLASSSCNLEKSLKEAFKDKQTERFLTLKDTLKPVLIPCYDLTSTAPFLFSRADALESESYDFNLWEVCMATSAEPGFVNPVQMSSVDGLTKCVGLDGGLAMNNPTAAAITHVLHNKQEFPFVRGVEDILVLSIGCGGGGGGGVLENGDFEGVRKWKAKDWARPIARISGEGSSELVDHAVALAFGGSRSSNYVRIQANGSGAGMCGAKVDSDPSPSNIKTLTGIADEMMKQKNVESVLLSGKRIGEQTNLEKLDWFAEQLVLEHQRRSCRIAPTVAFKQATTPKSS